MSVIRQPGMLGRTTRRRLVGVTAALTAAAIETLAVGLWFWLMVDARTTSTALVGLGILFCGAVLRTGVFGVTISDVSDLIQPRRLGAALALTGGWIVWLFLAEVIGGIRGIVIATLVLVGLLTGQLALERRAFHLRPGLFTAHPVLSLLVPAALLGLGASALLAATWLVDWAIVSPPLSLEITTVVIRIEAIQIGLLLFGCCAFLAHQRRLQRFLDR
ncbi:hypothetical protein D8Y22_06775 [Salinadaptatus halalkaliphilus]|uniref:Uncharacterized protein n=1 Tax=Salinadaptatus halalkaliphilus TaxID=2419781 RepID=A0A4S3TPL2_9EURY|nr:hypothetical protein [Salinadaptatus halalkaliphilus]THE65630.1 hypothetical protein D8Y22_06775 [Salinadaptatus halalkaliphilus]